MSQKEAQYDRDLDRFFAKIKAQYPNMWQGMTFAGYEAWSAGYKAGYAAGKAKGIKEATDNFRA